MRRDSVTHRVPAKRGYISSALRFQVFERDGFRCRYCGASPDDGAVLQLDHGYPHSQGGADTVDNLITACSQCNRGKAGRVVPSVGKRPQPKRAVIYEAGAWCPTPLWVAVLGRWHDYASYRTAHALIADKFPRDRRPPCRQADEQLWNIASGLEYQRVVTESLDHILGSA